MVHSLSAYMLSTCYVPGMRDLVEENTDTGPAFRNIKCVGTQIYFLMQVNKVQ